MSASPRRWMSILRGPRLQPPGMATRACPNRATSGPMIWMEARIFCTRSYGATCDCTAVVSMVMVPSSNSTTAPRYSSTSRMVRTSWMSGTLCRTLVPEASSEAAMSLSAEFFAPATATCPARAAPAADQKARLVSVRSHAGAQFSGHLGDFQPVASSL